jgi:hypothetical protein
MFTFLSTFKCDGNEGAMYIEVQNVLLSQRDMLHL